MVSESDNGYETIVLLKDGDAFIMADGCKLAFIKGRVARQSLREIESFSDIYKVSASAEAHPGVLVVGLNSLVDHWIKNDETKAFVRWRDA